MNNLNFRVWDIDQKQMVYFNFGDIRTARFFDEPNHQYIWQIPEGKIPFLKPTRITETDNPIMRGSGVFDIKGREIFEDDLVNGHYFGFNGNETDNLFENGEVMWSEWGCFGIQTKNGWLDFDQTSHFEEPCLEVIGKYLRKITCLTLKILHYLLF